MQWRCALSLLDSPFRLYLAFPMLQQPRKVSSVGFAVILRRDVYGLFALPSQES
jgi:hypothetical protein